MMRGVQELRGVRPQPEGSRRQGGGARDDERGPESSIGEGGLQKMPRTAKQHEDNNAWVNSLWGLVQEKNRLHMSGRKLLQQMQRQV